MKKYRFCLLALFLVTVISLNIKAQHSGELDTTFGTNGKTIANLNVTTTLNDIAVQSDGKIVATGQTFDPGSATTTGMVSRFNANGTLDPTFDGDGYVNTNFMRFANGVAVQPDGKILVCGYAAVSTSGHITVVRFNSNGSFDTTFNGTGKVTTVVGLQSSAYSISVQPDGKLLVTGYANISGTSLDFALVRYNSDGSLDASFGSNGRVATHLNSAEIAYDSAIQPDGKIVSVGYTTDTLSNQTIVAITRHNANGSLDTSFGNGGKVFRTEAANAEAKSVAVQSSGKIIVVGEGHPSLRYNADGSLNSTLNALGVVGESVTIQPDQKFLIGGYDTQNSQDHFAVARYNADGTVDAGFGNAGKASANVSGFVKALALQPNGKIIAGGNEGNSLVLTRFHNTVSPVSGWLDFDGDRKTDIAIYRPGAGQWWTLKSSDNSNQVVQFGASSDTIVPADYTGDGKTDFAVWRPSTGQWFVLRSEDYSYYAFPFGTAGDIPAPGDYDNDGRADAAVFRSSTNVWYIQLSGGGSTAYQFGASGDKPVPADYDGDGKTDVAIYRPAVSEWWINQSRDGVKAIRFGQSGDKAVAGDYTGDGKTDIAVWRPSTGEWFVIRSENNSFYGFPFGAAGDMPVPADYDGDGKTDAAVFRPSNSVWYLQRSTAGFSALSFGAADDMPVPNAYVK